MNPAVTYAPTTEQPPAYPNNNYVPQTAMPQHQGQQQQTNTTVVVNQGDTKNKLRQCDMHGVRNWTTGPLDCLVDMTNCLFTCFCYPLSLCQIAGRTGDCALSPCCIPGYPVLVRTRIRTIGGITGNACNDCLFTCVCPHLALCQEHRELTNMGF